MPAHGDYKGRIFDREVLVSEPLPTEGSATVRTAEEIARLVGKFPRLGIDEFVAARDYHQAENHRRELLDRVARMGLELQILRSSGGASEIPPKTGTCGHPALFTWHYTGYTRVPVCLHCKIADAEDDAKRLHKQFMDAKYPDSSGEPSAEPVAWYHNDFGVLELSRIRRVGWKPLYAHPSPEPVAKPDAVTPVEPQENHYGHNCPVGMVQVEFVGCSPQSRYCDYGWKPCKSTFIEVYVDGKRYRIDVGTIRDRSGGDRRGLHIIGPIDLKVDKHSINAVDVFHEPLPLTKDGKL